MRRSTSVDVQFRGTAVTTIDFRVLGEFQLHVAQAPVPLGSSKRRTLLAVLLASADETVPALSLIEELWPDGPPQHALANLRTYASELAPPAAARRRRRAHHDLQRRVPARSANGRVRPVAATAAVHDRARRDRRWPPRRCGC